MKKQIVAFLFISFFTCQVFAGSHYYRDRTLTGVSTYFIDQNSVLLIDIDGEKTGQVTCAANSNKRIAINSTAPQYKEVVSIVLAAYVSGKRIDLYVSEDCDFYPGAESLQGIKMGSMPF